MQKSTFRQNTQQLVPEAAQKKPLISCDLERTRHKATTPFATVWQGFPFKLTEAPLYFPICINFKLIIMKKLPLIVLMFLGFATQSFASFTTYAVPQDSTIEEKESPQVFLIANEKAFSQISHKYETQLLMACDDDMIKAYESWMHMLKSIEEHAEEYGFEIRGVKMWLKAFWNEEGMLDHVAYYLKPNSRNVHQDDMDAFFRSFCAVYKLPIDVETKISHYASAAFPTFYKYKKP